jgi:hypothetical protein
MGYAEFELDIPEVMRVELPKYFDGLAATPLTEQSISGIPANAQGAYLLFLDETIVYVGKTDAQAGFRTRLLRHYHNIQHRKNLDPSRVYFKAVRVFVFSNFDLETMLIEECTSRIGRPIWNFSGFGSNDPGRRREEQDSASFDLEYPVDIDRVIELIPPGEHDLLETIVSLKDGLPYLLRYETGGRHYRRGHPEMEARKISVAQGPITTRTILTNILSVLPGGWQATVLPNRVILYKELRNYREQVDIIRRAP